MHPNTHVPDTLAVTWRGGQQTMHVSAEKVNGYPVWESQDGKHWLLSTQVGEWLLTDDAAAVRGAEVAGGQLVSNGAHHGAMPHRVTDWLLGDGEGWRSEPGISVGLPADRVPVLATRRSWVSFATQDGEGSPRRGVGRALPRLTGRTDSARSMGGQRKSVGSLSERLEGGNADSATSVAAAKSATSSSLTGRPPRSPRSPRSPNGDRWPSRVVSSFCSSPAPSPPTKTASTMPSGPADSDSTRPAATPLKHAADIDFLKVTSEEVAATDSDLHIDNAIDAAWSSRSRVAPSHDPVWSGVPTYRPPSMAVTTGTATHDTVARKEGAAYPSSSAAFHPMSIRSVHKAPPSYADTASTASVHEMTLDDADYYSRSASLTCKAGARAPQSSAAADEAPHYPSEVRKGSLATVRSRRAPPPSSQGKAYSEDSSCAASEQRHVHDDYVFPHALSDASASTASFPSADGHRGKSPPASFGHASVAKPAPSSQHATPLGTDPSYAAPPPPSKLTKLREDGGGDPRMTPVSLQRPVAGVPTAALKPYASSYIPSVLKEAAPPPAAAPPSVAPPPEPQLPSRLSTYAPNPVPEQHPALMMAQPPLLPLPAPVYLPPPPPPPSVPLDVHTEAVLALQDQVAALTASLEQAVSAREIMRREKEAAEAQLAAASAQAATQHMETSAHDATLCGALKVLKQENEALRRDLAAAAEQLHVEQEHRAAGAIERTELYKKFVAADEGHRGDASRLQAAEGDAAALRAALQESQAQLAEARVALAGSERDAAQTQRTLADVQRYAERGDVERELAYQTRLVRAERELAELRRLPEALAEVESRLRTTHFALKSSEQELQTLKGGAAQQAAPGCEVVAAPEALLAAGFAPVPPVPALPAYPAVLAASPPLAVDGAALGLVDAMPLSRLPAELQARVDAALAPPPPPVPAPAAAPPVDTEAIVRLAGLRDLPPANPAGPPLNHLEVLPVMVPPAGEVLSVPPKASRTVAPPPPPDCEAGDAPGAAPRQTRFLSPRHGTPTPGELGAGLQPPPPPPPVLQPRRSISPTPPPSGPKMYRRV
eukprot:TRINITY_DN2199_c0_g1_i1.p1 TRINITY_DN2199_c0_g1~~TRINITY_DN2199_c0_g1_i1.p1  ORF type:complete len:1060 (+),score=304.29 TRINITY_DN2199_c0_g1_i1:87-3266(+)